MTKPFEGVYCAICNASLAECEVGEVADNPIYKMGELDSIELAHTACAVADNIVSGREIWKMGEVTA